MKIHGNKYTCVSPFDQLSTSIKLFWLFKNLKTVTKNGLKKLDHV